MTIRPGPARGRGDEVVANWARRNRTGLRAACENRRVRGFPLLAGALAATVVLVAGCGGGGTKTYTAAATRACLQKAGIEVTDVPHDDLIAQTAEGGGFTAHFKDNLVTLSFGLDRNGAESIVRRYQHFRGKNIGLEDVLRPTHNAVLLWALHPQAAYEQTIEGCLK